MRKYLAVFLGVLFLLSFAATALAQDKSEITIGGELKVWGWYLDNVAKGEEDSDYHLLPAKTNSQAWYTQRARLNVGAKVIESTSAFVQLETATRRESHTYTWGSFDEKPAADMWLRQAYMQHQGSGLLGVPAGVRIGHQVWAIGAKQFLDHSKYGDDAIMVWFDPIKELNMSLAAVKADEGSTAVAGDDVDAYVACANYKVDADNAVGLNFTWITSGMADSEDIDNLNLYNVGVFANGKFAGLSYAASFDQQFGKIDAVDGEDDKFRGYGVTAKVGYMLDPINIRASFAMGSGDNNLEDSKIKEFQTTLSQDPRYTAVYEWQLGTAAMNQILTDDSIRRGRSTGIANTTYYNIGMDYSPMKDLSLALDGYILRATKALDGQSKNVGSEVDLALTYKLNKNLTYAFTGGLFWPGKFYNPINEAFGVGDKKSVTFGVHSLTLSF